MARLQGADPGKQGLLGGLLTRFAYALTKRKVGRVVMPIQIVAHHSKILWGQAQMELWLGASRMVVINPGKRGTRQYGFKLPSIRLSLS